MSHTNAQSYLPPVFCIKNCASALKAVAPVRFLQKYSISLPYSVHIPFPNTGTIVTVKYVFDEIMKLAIEEKSRGTEVVSFDDAVAQTKSTTGFARTKGRVGQTMETGMREWSHTREVTPGNNRVVQLNCLGCDTRRPTGGGSGITSRSHLSWSRQTSEDRVFPRDP